MVEILDYCTIYAELLANQIFDGLLMMLLVGIENGLIGRSLQKSPK